MSVAATVTAAPRVRTIGLTKEFTLTGGRFARRSRAAHGVGLADPAAGRPATAETLYRVGSVSKLFTGIAVLQLVERGLVIQAHRARGLAGQFEQGVADYVLKPAPPARVQAAIERARARIHRGEPGPGQTAIARLRTALNAVLRKHNQETPVAMNS